MTTADRWETLRAALEDNLGTPVALTARPYSEAVYGRVTHGVSYSITLRHPAGGTVHVADSWWQKNPAKWTGYTVTHSGADSIDRGDRRGLRSRSAAVDAVHEFLAPAGIR
jgi:hypothetical protein